MSIVFEKKTDTIFFWKCEYEGLQETVHCHSEFEMVICCKGSFDAYINSRRYTVQPGELIIVFPNQIHTYINSELGEFYVITFSADHVLELKKLLLNNVLRDNKVNFKNFSEIDDIVTELTTKYDRKKPFASSLLMGYINLLMAKILTYTELIPSVATNDNLLVDVLDYCNNNFSKKIALKDIASAMYVSTPKLTKLLNRQLNTSLPQLMNFIRVSKACSLLKDTNMAITDIASTVGFGSLRSFNRSFLDIVGKTPSDFRLELFKEKKHNKNQSK